MDRFNRYSGNKPATDRFGETWASNKRLSDTEPIGTYNTLTVKRLKVGQPVTTYPGTTPAVANSVLVGQPDGTTAWVDEASIQHSQITDPNNAQSYASMASDQLVVKALNRTVLNTSNDVAYMAGPTTGPLAPAPEFIQLGVSGTQLKLTGAAASNVLTCTAVDGACSWQTPATPVKIASPDTFNSVECTNAQIFATADGGLATIRMFHAPPGDVGGYIQLKAMQSGIEYNQIDVRRGGMYFQQWSQITNSLIGRMYISQVDQVFVNPTGLTVLELSSNGVCIDNRYTLPRTTPSYGQYIRATADNDAGGKRITKWTSPSFASHYYIDNNLTAVALPGANSYVPLGIGRTVAATSADFVSGVDGLQYTGIDTLNFVVTASMTSISSGPQNETYRFKFSVGGTPLNAGSASVRLDNTNTYPVTTTMSTILSLVTGQKVDVVVANLASTQDLIVSDFTLTLHCI